MKKYFTILMLMLFSFCFISCNDINDLDKNEENKIEEKDPEEQKDPEQKDPEENKDPEEQKDPIENKELEELEKEYNAFLLEYPEYTGTIEDYKKAIEENDLCSLYGHKYQLVSSERYSETEIKIIYFCKVCNKEKEVIEEIDNTNYEIKISGDQEIIKGYSTTLTITTTPECDVIWSSSNENVATVDQNGKVTAINIGVARIKAQSLNNPNCYDVYKIIITDFVNQEEYPNMLGYEIVIMTNASQLTSVDPFLDRYTGADKIYKQQAWREVEDNFNCKITVKSYPETVIWGDKLIDYLINSVDNNTPECDIAIADSNWIYKFARANTAVDVYNLYKTYGKDQMEPSLRQAGTYKNNLYIASLGIDETKVYPEIGLFYNITWVEELGLENPAKLFLEDKWTYSDFTKWIKEAQEKIGGDGTKKALGGHPATFYYGMTNASGINVVNYGYLQANTKTIYSEKACELIWSLVEAGCVNTTPIWNSTSGGTDFMSGDILMSTGYLSYFLMDSRFNLNVWGADANLGYVPFPYPDEINKEDTKVSITRADVYMYVNGRTYPESVGIKDVYRAINELFLNTIKYQQEAEDYNKENIVKDTLKGIITDEYSINSLMYYDSSKVFFDSSPILYGSIYESPITEAAIDVMYKGVSFDEAFKDIDNTITIKLNEIYG